jgi:hypothetical protein
LVIYKIKIRQIKRKTVFVLMFSEPDWVSISVYEKEKDALWELKKIAREKNMILETYSAHGRDTYASVEEKEVG